MPTSSASPRSLVPLLAVFALLVILLVAWASQRAQENSRSVSSPRKQSGFQDMMSGLSSQSGESRRAAEIDASAPASRAVSTSRTGRLLLHVTDAASGTPLVGAACRIYAERDGDVTYGKLTTDDEGRASIDSLPENTILVHVERKPPHASTYAGVWLREGETRELEVKVGPGGVIAGRAVDDAGQPLADVDVFLGLEARSKESVPESRTSADGRFEILHIVSAPRSVWIVDGVMRPGSWDDITLQLKWADVFAVATVQVEDGKRVEIGDVVLDRPSVLSGRVLDARHDPVPDALMAWDRGPEDLRREALSSLGQPRPGAGNKKRWRTNADGSFELPIVAWAGAICVATNEGIAKHFLLPRMAPGERLTDLELILDDVQILELELVDAAGRRVTRGADADEGVRSRGAGGFTRLEVKLAFEDGSEVSKSQGPDEDDLFRIQTPGARSAKRRLRLVLPGFLPVQAELGEAVGLVDHRRFTLRPLPSIRAHVKVHASGQPKSQRSSAQLLVQACLIPPNEFTEQIRSAPGSCCGLGSSFLAPFGELDRDLGLPVLSESESFWLYAIVMQDEHREGDVHGTRLLYEAHFGPFVPGAMTHPIEIPAIEVPEPNEDAVRKKLETEPPPVTSPANARAKNPLDDEAKSPKTRLRLEEADGRPVPRETHVTALPLTPRHEFWPGGYIKDEAGGVEIESELGGRCALSIREHRVDSVIGDMWAQQIVAVDAIESYGSRPLTLAPWHAIDVFVTGAAGELPEATLQVSLAMLDRPAFIPSAYLLLPVREAAPLPGGSRHFRAWGSPGKYEITLKSGLFEAPRVEVEVRNADEPQRFQLSSTRR